MKKILSVLCMISVFLGASVIPSSAEAVSNSSEIITVNPGLEDELTEYINGWGGFNADIGRLDCNNIRTDSVHTGINSVTVPEGYSEFIYTEFKCKSNTDYKLSFWRQNASGISYYVIPDMRKAYGTADKGFFSLKALAQGTISGSSDWTKEIVTFNSGAYTSVSLVLRNNGSGNSSSRFDDVDIIENPDSGKIIKNGGFEYGLDYWKYWNVNADISENAYEGEYSAALPSTATEVYPGFYQEFTVEKNTFYRLSFSYKGKVSYQSVWSVSDSGTSATSGSYLCDSFYNSDSWKKVDRVFKSKENTVLRLWLRGGVSSELYIDDVSVEKYTKPISETAEKPEIASHTQSSVTLKDAPGCEYSADGISFQASPTFTGLLTGIEYKFVQRLKADEFNAVGAASDSVSFKITALGDSDGNGEVDSRDLAVLKKVLLESTEEYSEEGCDCDGKDGIDLRDLVNLKKRLTEITGTGNTLICGADISDFTVCYSGDSEEVLEAIEALNSAVKARIGEALAVEGDSENESKIAFTIDETLYKAYVLDACKNTVMVTASDAERLSEIISVLTDRINGYPKEKRLNITEDFYMDSTLNENLYGAKLVAFTFDDIPHYQFYGDNNTSVIMDAFKRYNSSATFFAVGSNFGYYGTDLVQYAVDNGFEIGNHGMRHTLGTTEEAVTAEICDLNTYIKERYGYTMRFYRPSGLDTNEALFTVAERLNMPIIGAAAYTNDWDIENSSAEDIKNTCIRGAQDGNIILMHANSKVADVIDEVLEELYNDGFRFVTLSELFRYKGIAYDDIPKNIMISGINQIK